jgi:hypothetical protein
MKILFILLIFLFFFASYAAESTEKVPAKKTVTVIPGEEYQAGWLHRMFLGAHWRSLWTSALNVPVIDLIKYAGGLSPLKRGGGFQTKSLHFKAKNGKFYKFRSLNKDPKKVLPYYLQKTFVADVVQDQISTSHPFSAFIVAPLLNSVGVLNAEPILVVLPDDPVLGEYREEFKNVLGTLAENPKDDTDADLIFAGADKVIDDYDIFEKLEADNENQVDAEEYLKARLMDIFVGDWDRHIGQWKWARFHENSYKIYKPIPRDRDQAFSRYDGIFPYMVAKAVPQIEHFSEDYPQINDLTWSGRHLDRRLLVSVDRTAWDSVTTFIFERLTDSVIDSAVKRMPEEWFEQEGETLIAQLKFRRDTLPAISQEYYYLMSKYVSIFASDKAEHAVISRLDDQKVRVQIFDKNRQSIPKATPFYDRTFDHTDTREIRLDLLDGDDTAIINGTVNSSLIVRVIGGKGADELIDDSIVNGYFLSVTPIPDAETSTFFYDSGDKTLFKSGPSTKIERDKVDAPKSFNPETDNVNEKYEPQTEDRGHDWKAGAWINYNSDNGLFLGGGPILYEFGFRMKPFVYRMELMAAYATTPQSFHIRYMGEFYSLLKRWRVLVDIGKSELGFTKFYGFGNETTRDDDLEDDDFYRVGQELIHVNTYFEYLLSPNSRIGIGTIYSNSELYFDAGTILDQPVYSNLVGLDNVSYMGLRAGFSHDSRDNVSAPYEGFYIDFKSALFPHFLNTNKSFGKVSAVASTYLTSQFITHATLAMRLGGQKRWGSFPLYEAAFLGGEENIRGFNRERFAGSASAYGTAEWRVYLFPLKMIVPAQFGFTSFVESGRVFNSGDESDKWHVSYGGGLWISFIERLATTNLTVAKSTETISYYLTFGFMF